MSGNIEEIQNYPKQGKSRAAVFISRKSEDVASFV